LGEKINAAKKNAKAVRRPAKGNESTFMPRHKNAGHIRDMKITNKPKFFKNIVTFKCVGTTLTDRNCSNKNVIR
jgi:hypothetical protein